MPPLRADKETARRILRAVRRVEQEPRRKERKRRRVIPPATMNDKILFLPLNDEANYVLPQYLASTAYGYEMTVHATNLANFDTDVELPIIDYYGSIALPGQKLQCRYSDALEAYTPFPFGQNAMQFARTYKPIPAGGSVSGDDIFFTGYDGNQTNGDLIELSELVNDEVFFPHAHSNIDIEASESAPLEIIVYLFNAAGGVEVRIIGRACNP